MKTRFIATAFLIGAAISQIFPSDCQAQSVPQVIQGMQARWARINDASAVIEIQTWKKSEGDKVSVFYGQIYYHAPKLIRLEYSPAPDSASGTHSEHPTLYPFGENKYIYIHDGRTLLRYSPSQKQWLDQYGSDPVISMVNQIADINNFNVDRFLSIYEVADVRSDNSLGIPTYILRAEPKNPRGPNPRQLMWIHAQTYLPVEAIMAKADNEVSAFFHKIKQNVNLPMDIFSTKWKK
jgi:outer membrane lipoprotein-sorting protein